MSLQIIDGKGSGSALQIHDHRAQVDAIIHSALEEHSKIGKAFSWTAVTYNYDAADTIIGVRNTSLTHNLHLDRILMSGDTATIVNAHRVNGSAALAGTAITGVNLNGASGAVAEADAKADETTNTNQGDILFNAEMEAAKMLEIDLEGAVILGANDMFGLDYVTVGGTCSITVFGFYLLKAS